MLLVAAGLSANTESAETPWTLNLDIDAVVAGSCPFEQSQPDSLPAGIFDYMAQDSGQALACVEWLDANFPGWHNAEGARALVVPFVRFLLGDGSNHGLQRHVVFLGLLGSLEKIEPGWRFDASVQALMPEMILGSIVEDPFVADFWSRTLGEMDPDWKQTSTARALAPQIYELAVEDAAPGQRPPSGRAKMLLKEISWPAWARLVVSTKLLNSWPKRAAVFTAAMLLIFIVLVGWRRRARPAPEVRQAE